MGLIAERVESNTMNLTSCFFVMAALLVMCESEAQFGFGGGVAVSNCVGSNCNHNNAFGRLTSGGIGGSRFGGGVAINNCVGSNCNQNNSFKRTSSGGLAINNCVGSNCNSNNFFGRQRRLVLEKVLAGVEEESVDEKRQLLEEILTEVEEEELSGERKQPSLDFIGSSSGLESPSRVHDLLKQIVEKLNELSSKLGSSARSALPTFPAGTKFYTSDGRGGLSAIRAPVISVPLEKSHFDNDPVKRTEEIGEQIISLTEQVKSQFEINPVKRTEEISGQINFLTEQERREITKLLLKKLLV